MDDSERTLRVTAWSTIGLGMPMALAHYAWFSINNGKMGTPPLDGPYTALTGMAVLSWSLVVVCGALCLITGRPPHRALAIAAAISVTVGALIGLVLLVITARGAYGDGAFDDALTQSWPLLVAAMFSADWVRRSFTASAARQSASAA